MIRRDDGDDWIIIEQIKHANLAAEVARAWGNEQFESLTAHPTGTALHQAVANHDDGWNEWDWAPRLDPRTGKPRDFREMRMSDATAIWSKSVRAADGPLPLAAYAVSRHFCYLADLVRDGGRHDAHDLAAVTRFLAEQSQEQARLEQKAKTRGSIYEFGPDRELAYRTVQFFDRVSLWLCCSDERGPQPMTAPLGEVVTFSARPAPPTPAESTSTVYRLETSRPDFRKWCVAIEPYPLGRTRSAITRTNSALTLVASPRARMSTTRTLRRHGTMPLPCAWFGCSVRAQSRHKNGVGGIRVARRLHRRQARDSKIGLSRRSTRRGVGESLAPGWCSGSSSLPLE